MALRRACAICQTEFEVLFRYQAEERADGLGLFYYCSQSCLEKSHATERDGSTLCEACGTSFQLELACQVVYLDAKRRYACGEDCRRFLLARARSAEQRQSGIFARSEARVIAVFNHKGGTGKTTTAVSLAAGLAARGQRVLLVDSDGQGNVAVSLGLRGEKTLYHVLVMGLSVRDAAQRARENLDVLASNETLAAAELYLAGRKRRDRVMAERLAEARAHYDVVVVDCSPSLSLMSQNALVFADWVLCPVACDYLSLVGVRQVLRTIKHVNQLLEHPVRLWGVLPTMFDARARICHEALATLREHFQERCLEPVRLAIKVKEAPAQAKTLFEHAPGSGPVTDYERVIEKLLSDIAGERQEPALSETGGLG